LDAPRALADEWDQSPLPPIGMISPLSLATTLGLRFTAKEL